MVRTYSAAGHDPVTEPVFRLVDHLEEVHWIPVGPGTSVVDAHRAHVADHAGRDDQAHDHRDRSWWSKHALAR